DPACERTHQQMMRLKHLAGDRTGAMRQYDRCVKALCQELGVQRLEDILKFISPYLKSASRSVGRGTWRSIWFGWRRWRR
ncbi:MAG: bacterial transcriptional activator domain-containing protein, partial [Blastocatellia bacterium]